MDDDIKEIAATIWETLFSMPLDSGAADDEVGDPAVTGCVHIEGAWHGAVLLTCGHDLARRLTGELYQSSDPSSDEIRDAVGELTNMLAGNIKAMLPEPSQISLPTVALGGDFNLSVVGARPVSEVRMQAGGAPVLITLVQRTEDEGQ